ncbi:MAG: hypothetical protein QXY11_05665 [Desulfurococcaceae archaeon]
MARLFVHVDDDSSIWFHTVVSWVVWFNKEESKKALNKAVMLWRCRGLVLGECS